MRPVCCGAKLECSFGVAESPLLIWPRPIVAGGPVQFVATILDNRPLLNIIPFGACTSPLNPFPPATPADSAAVAALSLAMDEANGRGPGQGSRSDSGEESEEESNVQTAAEIVDAIPMSAGGKQCLPALLLPWINIAPSISVLGIPILDDSATLLCAYGGIIRVTDPGQDFTKHTPASLVGG